MYVYVYEFVNEFMYITVSNAYVYVVVFVGYDVSQLPHVWYDVGVKSKRA